jgi:hypothetical protein
MDIHLLALYFEGLTLIRLHPIIKKWYLFSFLKFKYYFRQDLQDYFDFCAFPPAGGQGKAQTEYLMDRIISFRWKRIEVAQGRPEPEQKPVNPVNPV